MKLAAINGGLYIASEDGHRRVDGEFGSDPIRTLLDSGINTESLLRHAGDPELPQNGPVRFDPPIRQPSKIVCIGLNYLDHCREAGVDVPDSIVSFTKHPSSLIGSGEAIVLDPALSSKVDYEIELAVIFGRECRDVRPEEAQNVIAGFTIANDVSARDLQLQEGQWVRAKSFDTFCPFGPYLVTPDEIPDPQNLALRTDLSGTAMQDSTTAEMIVPVYELIAHVTRGTTFFTGDILLTGTPWGTGAFMSPPVYLRSGDDLRCSITGLGELHNPVVSVSAAETQ